MIESLVVHTRLCVPEVDDVQGDRKRQLEFRGSFNQPGEILRLFDILLDKAAILLRSLLFYGHPGLEGVEAAGELESVIVKPGEVDTGQSPVTLAVGKVGRGQGECPSVQFSVPDEHTADRILQVHPLVQVKGERIRLFHPRNEVPGFRGDSCPGTECPIDMEPAPLSRADIGKSMQVVNRPGIRRPGSPDDTDGAKPVCPVLLNP